MNRRLALPFTLLLLLVSPAFAQDLPVKDGLQLWLDATDQATVLGVDGPIAAGDEVFSWLDKSENEFEVFNEADPIQSPTYESDVMNGQPAIRFNGTDGDGMSIPELEVLHPYTTFIVNQYWGDVRGRTLQSVDVNWLHGFWAGNVSTFANGFVGTNPPAIKDFVYVADHTGTETESSLFVNGSDLTSQSAAVQAPARLALGTAGQFAEASDADISEVIVFDRVLDDDELELMRDYLYTKYETTPIEFQLPDPVVKEVLFGELTLFTGADPGEGLDLEGEFEYAVNVGGPELPVGSLDFTDGSIEFGTPGADISLAAEIGVWHAAEYGDSLEDDELEVVMQSIRHNGDGFDLDVEAGQAYKLQLMFGDACCDRGFDILLDGELAVDNFKIATEQGGELSTANGVLYTHSFIAADDVLNVGLTGPHEGAADQNPILNAITLEVLESLEILGDCNDDSLLDGSDLVCITAVEERNAVLGAIGSLPGDFNGNGEVDFNDFLTLAANFGAEGSYAEGNVDVAGTIDFLDFLAFADNFGKTPDAVAAVPEPTGCSLASLMTVLIAMMTRRNSRR